MNQKFKLMLLGIGASGLVACGTHKAASQAQADDWQKAKATSSSSLHKIDLPKYQPDLPAGPGREVFAASCLSCHTAKYISMQPALSAAKWEEEVKKMGKTYMAPIGDDQVQPIVQYLMATKESGHSTGTWIAGAANVQQQPVPGIALDGADLKHGAAVYAQACASCHGAGGKGDGISAKTLLPRPTDLTHAVYSKELMTQSIYNGVPATAMPAFSMLPKETLRDVIAYSLSLSQGQKHAEKPANVESGKTLYSQHCINCHGADGGGDGVNAPVTPRPPANFKLKQPSLEQAMQIITSGVPGTTMPAWKAKLNPEQTQALAEYVQSFYVAK